MWIDSAILSLALTPCVPLRSLSRKLGPQVQRQHIPQGNGIATVCERACPTNCSCIRNRSRVSLKRCTDLTQTVGELFSPWPEPTSCPLHRQQAYFGPTVCLVLSTTTLTITNAGAGFPFSDAEPILIAPRFCLRGAGPQEGQVNLSPGQQSTGGFSWVRDSQK